MKNTFLAILLLIQICVFSQQIKKDNFNLFITDSQGHLNKDSYLDKVVITEDTISDKLPYKLEIFFGQPKGKFKLIASTTKIIEAQFPNGRKKLRSQKKIPDFFVENGNLIIMYDIEKGHSTYTFRFQKGNFELINIEKITMVNQDQGTTVDEKFNLLTGVRFQKIQSYESKTLIKKLKKIVIKPLPKIQDIKPFKNEFY
jgi:hypothetical protein